MGDDELIARLRDVLYLVIDGASIEDCERAAKLLLRVGWKPSE